MKLLTKDLSGRDRVLAIILGIVIVLMLYYLAVDRPVRSGLKEASAEKKELEAQLEDIEYQIEEIKSMKSELSNLSQNGAVVSRMPSYNGEKREVNFLHTTLENTLDYYIGFNNVTREGDQIRRDFSLRFKAKDYLSSIEVMRQLEKSKIRCLIGDVSVSSAGDSGIITNQEPVQVSCTATFYETMQGGKEDRELPPDSAAAK